VQFPIVECEAKGALFIGSEVIVSDKAYYRKQVQLPIVECGAKGAPFIGSEEIASDKTYYRMLLSVF